MENDHEQDLFTALALIVVSVCLFIIMSGCITTTLTPNDFENCMIGCEDHSGLKELSRKPVGNLRGCRCYDETLLWQDLDDDLIIYD